MKKMSIDINPWIQEIAVSFKRLKLIHIRHMDVNDSDLELLARPRGRDLRVLKICKCKWFSTDGLLHIGKYCNDLRTLCLKGNQFNNKDGKWLHELALQKTGIESLDFRLEDFVGGEWVEDQVFAGFMFPTIVRTWKFSIPILSLETWDCKLLVSFARKLLKFRAHDWVTHMGLITMVQGCLELKSLQIKLTDISIETMECIGTHLKKLRDFKMSLSYRYIKTYLPLDNGIRAMLIGCSKLERLSIRLQPRHRGLTYVGLGYIEKYGHNLRYLYLRYVGESDAGLMELSKGCSKFRKLDMMVCPFSEQAIATFVYNISALKYVWIRDTCGHATLVLTRSNS
nr:hypothetical protein [Tanacetum cinerariifolium]